MKAIGGLGITAGFLPRPPSPDESISILRYESLSITNAVAPVKFEIDVAKVDFFLGRLIVLPKLLTFKKYHFRYTKFSAIIL